jgi:hypothetical protein
MQAKRLGKSATIIALVMALGAGFTAAPAQADTPSQPWSIKAMDANKDGKVTKSEYLEFMGKQFDKSAGAKGYCTFEEIKQAFPESSYI